MLWCCCCCYVVGVAVEERARAARSIIHVSDFSTELQAHGTLRAPSKDSAPEKDQWIQMPRIMPTMRILKKTAK